MLCMRTRVIVNHEKNLKSGKCTLVSKAPRLLSCGGGASFSLGGAPLGAPLFGGPGFNSTSPDKSNFSCTTVIFV